MYKLYINIFIDLNNNLKIINIIYIYGENRKR